MPSKLAARTFTAWRWLRRDDRNPWLLETRSSPTFITIVCTVAIFTDGFVYGVVVPVLPFSLTNRVNVPPDNVEHWVSALLACYAGGFLLACPAAGWITDHCSSRRAVFAFATCITASSTILFCLGNSVAVFSIARILQGFSSAFSWTASLALLSDTVGHSKVGKAMGFCSVGLNGALFVAPMIGGLMLEEGGFSSVFIVTLGFIILDLGLRLLVVEEKPQSARSSSRSNWIITFGLHGTPSINPSPCAQIEDIETWFLSSDKDSEPLAYCNHEASKSRLSRFQDRLPLLLLLRYRRFCVLLWANFAKITMITAFDAVLPLFVHNTFGWGSLGGGLIFIPVVVPTFVAPLVGELSDKYGSRFFIFGGFLMATPFLTFLRLVKNDSAGHIALLCSLLSFLGLATTLITAPVMADITYLVETEERRQPGIFGSKGPYAQAYALYCLTTAAGLLIGPCWGGFLTNAAGWGTMTFTLGLFCAITAVPMFLWLR